MPPFPHNYLYLSAGLRAQLWTDARFVFPATTYADVFPLCFHLFSFICCWVWCGKKGFLPPSSHVPRNWNKCHALIAIDWAFVKRGLSSACTMPPTYCRLVSLVTSVPPNFNRQLAISIHRIKFAVQTFPFATLIYREWLACQFREGGELALR